MGQNGPHPSQDLQSAVPTKIKTYHQHHTSYVYYHVEISIVSHPHERKGLCPRDSSSSSPTFVVGHKALFPGLWEWGGQRVCQEALCTFK